jgi:Transmembrane Fragile-X-F protein
MDPVTLIFLILKLTHTVDWSWWVVFLPLEISAGFSLLWFGLLALFVGTSARSDRTVQRRLRAASDATRRKNGYR